ncbi:hypothetical protein Tco_0327166 [Tanacetum coccineum]
MVPSLYSRTASADLPKYPYYRVLHALTKPLLRGGDGDGVVMTRSLSTSTSGGRDMKSEVGRSRRAKCSSSSSSPAYLVTLIHTSASPQLNRIAHHSSSPIIFPSIR